jgi:hypothetical protein
LPDRSIGAFTFGEILGGERLCVESGCSAASSLDLIGVTAAGVDACAVNPQVAAAKVAAIATMPRLLRRVLADIEFSLCC